MRSGGDLSPSRARRSLIQSWCVNSHRAGSRSRVQIPQLDKVREYMGCGVEVQNYDRASFTLKVNAHRDGQDLTLPLEAVGKVRRTLAALQLDESR